MQIRRGKLEDMGRILTYMSDYHKNSNLSRVPFDRKSASQIVEYYIMSKDTLPLIAIEEDKMIGLLFGSLEPFFFNQKKNYATDLMFFSKGAGTQLWKTFKDWAFSMGADRIIMGVSSGDERADQLLGALGMSAIGGMYEFRQESS